LQVAGQQIRDYFNNDLNQITINISLHGDNVPNLFNEKEILHMYDVKQLVKMVYLVQLYSAILLSMGCVFILFNPSTNRGILTLKYFSRGGMFTFSLVIAVSVLAIIGFDRLFLFFHLVSFSNESWILDPRHDYLIAMFPQGFFFDCTVAIAFLTLLEGGILSLIPRVIWLVGKK
jgi:integral membrane protein (TIGR01906 family)